MKEGNSSQEKKGGLTGGGGDAGGKYQKLFFMLGYTFTSCIYDATLWLLLQVLSCLYICLREQMHMSMCVWSREHLHTCQQMFRVSPTWSRSDPSIFLSSPSPLLSFREHLFFGAMWVTPASQRRRRGIRSPYKVVTIEAGNAKGASAPGGRKWGWGAMRRLTALNMHHVWMNLCEGSTLTQPQNFLTLLPNIQPATNRYQGREADRRVRHIHFSLCSCSYLIQEQTTNGWGASVITQLDKVAAFVVFTPRVCVCVCALILSFDHCRGKQCANTAQSL